MPASSFEHMPVEASCDDRPSSPIEVHRFHCLRTVFLVGYVLVLIGMVLSVRFVSAETDLGKVILVFGLLVGPAAMLLLLLHVYETWGLVRFGTHAVPLTLDLTYFGFFVVSAVTFGGFWSLFLFYEISAPALSLMWWGLVVLLVGELLGCMLASRFIVRRLVCPRLPSFFAHSEHHNFRHPRDRPRLFLHRNIPNWAIWEQDDCFIRMKHG